MPIITDIQKLQPGKLVELYELDSTAIGGVMQRFHGYADNSTIFWGGNEYEPWSIKAEGFSRSSSGQQASPTLTVGNIGKDENGNIIPGIISSLCLALDDLVGAKVIRRRTLVKYLDAVNWVAHSGTAQNATRASLTLAAGASAQDGQYVGETLYLTGGAGSVQEQKIISYNGASKVATLESGWRQNLLPWSNNQANAVWEKNGFTAAFDANEHATKLTVTNTTLAYCGHRLTMNPANKSLTFFVDVKGIGSTIGKKCRLFVYRATPGGDTLTSEFLVTGNWQRISITNEFDSTSATFVWVRFDAFETGSALNDQFFIRNLQLCDGEVTKYIETESFTVAMPDSTSTYEVRHSHHSESSPDPTQELPPEIWIVEQKSVETAEMVEFVLSSPLNFDGKMLPGRQILASMCPFLWKGGYRGPYCGYTGNRYFDKNDNAVSDPALDKCGGRVNSCKIRFDPDPLNYGGFESADRIGRR